MIYNKDSHINSISEVKAYIHHLVEDLGMSLHPDDDFNIYINPKTGKKLYSEEEASLYNRLMDECCIFCKANNEDIYVIAIDEIENHLAKHNVQF